MAESSISRRLRRRLINGVLHLSNTLLDSVLRWHKPCSTPAVHEIPDDLVREILTWLPVKSLMRFKSVSRGWLSIITDPSFASSYRGGLRGLFACPEPMPPGCPGLSLKEDFYRVNLDEAIATQVIVDPGSRDLGYTNFVNGLICFYSANCSWLYNISTRESLQLPISELESSACTYHFGFEPVSKLYKLLKICPVYEALGAYENAVFVCNMKCEILTIGVDASWRIVDSLPPVEIKSDCECIGGALYWLESNPIGPGGRILAFDLAEEKFQPFIPTNPNVFVGSLAKFGPGLALFSSRTTPDFDHPSISYYSKGDGRDSMGAWGPALKYQFPYEKSKLGSGGGISLHSQGILPNGKVVIYEFSLPFAIFLWDPSKGEFEEIEVTALNSLGEDIDLTFLTFYYYEENIMPLRCLASCP